MGRVLYTIYIVLIFTPLFTIITILSAIAASLSTFVGLERFGTMYPGMIWSKLTMILSLCRITVEGRENIPSDKCCVVACNHQSAFDIWALYGYTHIPFKWVLKGSLN
ncbi:MAG: 1-acyl-sn-glycerol-3-phosphate acyltransferase, partial [Porphyromonas sp.]|nr:1-acyl-sn-glycerol-3-phosphate acyltransferase [Porphyromonas sp.]